MKSMEGSSLSFVPASWGAFAPCISACALGVQLPITNLGNLEAPTSGAHSFLDPVSLVQFSGGTGVILHDAVAVARYLALTSGAAGAQYLPDESSPDRPLVEHWLEFEEKRLRPAIASCIQTDARVPEELLSALKHAVHATGHVAGGHLTLADIAIWSALLPVYGSAAGGGSAGAAGALARWFGTLRDTAPFRTGVAMALAGSSVDDVAKRIQELGQPAPGPSTASKSHAPAVQTASRQGLIDGQREVRVPIKGKRNILVTSALPYVNNVPHLGNIIGCVLSADVYARYCRRRGYNVIYICGTDEYGTATETKAMEEGTTPKAICDKYYDIHKEIYEWFDISFDKFGRTSTPKQTEICQAIFNSLLKQGRLFEDKMEQPYCDTCQRFLADRFVEGTCPHCAYEDARGDQCDKCQKLLNATDLINPRCKICGNPPRIRETQHMFLDLPGLKDRLEAYVDATAAAGGWSANSIQTTRAWIRDGLKPRCITRDLKWGVPVPLEQFRDKVFYVWFDAPIGYISITANYTDQWEAWWKSPKDVELVQFMGKDNVPFHTVIFPCTLLGTDEPWTLLRTISVTEYLNYEGGKFSKSRGVGVFGNDAMATGIPVEIWRYYLLINRPEASDTQFTWSDLQAKENNELLKNLGNFVNRTLAFVDKPDGKGYGSVVPDSGDPSGDHLTAELGARVGELVTEYIAAMEKVKLKAGLQAAMAVSSTGNKYLQDSQFFKLFKDDRARCDIVLRTAVGLVQLLATLLEPFMPSVSRKILVQLNRPESTLALTDEAGDVARAARPWELVPAGHVIGRPEPIFAEMLDEEVERFRVRFAGSQSDRIAAENAAGAAATAAPASNSGAPGASAATDGAVPEEKGKAKAGAAGASKAAGGGGKKVAGKGSDEGPVDISRLNIRVGVIKKVQRHPDADSLYVEEIDCGEESLRTVVSGLVKFVPIEEMEGRRVCLLCNLKPAKMRGVLSQAMVLAASNADHTRVELVTPPASAEVGERVVVPGYPGEPDEQLNPKKKVWEAVQVDLATSESCVATYKGAPFTTSAGVCVVGTLAGGSIS